MRINTKHLIAGYRATVHYRIIRPTRIFQVDPCIKKAHERVKRYLGFGVGQKVEIEPVIWEVEVFSDY